VVINRPSTTAVSDALPEWRDQASEPPVVFIGGPVNPSAAICLASSSGSVDVDGTDGLRLLQQGLGIVDLERAPGDMPVALAGLRVFAGYAGWSPGQLEGEIEAGAWFVVDTMPGDVLSARPQRLWHDVLHRQPGTISAIANFPSELSQN